MEHRDYLMRQIEQLGQVLAQMLAWLLGIRKKGGGSLGVEEIMHTYKSKLDIDLEELIQIPEKDLILFLKRKNEHFESHLEIMADILHETALYYLKYERSEDGKNLLRKAIVILEYLQSSSKDYSIDRMLKIENYNKTLDLRQI
jgi:hypothetical protein